jgi:hypothetical protein
MTSLQFAFKEKPCICSAARLKYFKVIGEIKEKKKLMQDLDTGEEISSQ